MKNINTALLTLSLCLSNIEPTQNITWLKPYISCPVDLGPSRIHPDPDVVDGEEDDEIEVILADCYNGS